MRSTDSRSPCDRRCRRGGALRLEDKLADRVCEGLGLIAHDQRVAVGKLDEPRVWEQLGQAPTAGDASQSWLCAISAAAVLVSILGNAALGWWWLDPIAGLGIAGLAVREGREAWTGKVCGDCSPIGFESVEICGEQGCC